MLTVVTEENGEMMARMLTLLTSMASLDVVSRTPPFSFRMMILTCLHCTSLTWHLNFSSADTLKRVSQSTEHKNTSPSFIHALYLPMADE